jgi:hypothetical protein
VLRKTVHGRNIVNGKGGLSFVAKSRVPIFYQNQKKIQNDLKIYRMAVK